MKTLAVIPARYNSSRMPGKPLAQICGRPMVWWVYQEALKVEEFDDVIVATESDVVIDECRKLNIKVMKTLDSHTTGTDRVAEVATKIAADVYIIVMGDEPLITAEDEKRLLQSIIINNEVDAVMLTEEFVNPVDLANMTTIKLAINDEGYLIFMSRAIIPYPKETIGYSYFKNVGCYGFRREALDFFFNSKPGFLEKAEGIELLRLLENHKRILTVPIKSTSMAVDTEKDLKRVEAEMKVRINLQKGSRLMS